MKCNRSDIILFWGDGQRSNRAGKKRIKTFTSCSSFAAQLFSKFHTYQLRFERLKSCIPGPFVWMQFSPIRFRSLERCRFWTFALCVSRKFKFCNFWAKNTYTVFRFILWGAHDEFVPSQVYFSNPSPIATIENIKLQRLPGSGLNIFLTMLDNNLKLTSLSWQSQPSERWSASHVWYEGRFPASFQLEYEGSLHWPLKNLLL